MKGAIALFLSGFCITAVTIMFVATTQTVVDPPRDFNSASVLVI